MTTTEELAGVTFDDPETITSDFQLTRSASNSSISTTTPPPAPAWAKSLVIRGTSVTSVTIPYNVKREAERRANIIFNRRKSILEAFASDESHT